MPLVSVHLAPVQCNNPGSSGRVVEHWHFLAWSCDSWSSSPTRESGLLLFYLKTVYLLPRSSLSSWFGQSEQSHICGDAAYSTLGRRPLTPFPAARAVKFLQKHQKEIGQGIVCGVLASSPWGAFGPPQKGMFPTVFGTQ